MKISTIISASVTLAAAISTTYAGYGSIQCTKPGVVAYTFDDGPGYFNAKLLAKLAKYDIKATFFVLGQSVEQLPDALKATYNAGHQIASHTFNHPSLDSLSASQIRNQVTTTSNAIQNAIGVRPNYIRAPQGNCGNTCQGVMKSLGQSVVYWNVDTNDWRYTGQAKHDLKGALRNAMKEVNDKIINNSNPETDSFIVLQHEIHEYSVEYLVDLVATAIKKKGYRFVTIEECLGRAAYA